LFRIRKFPEAFWILEDKGPCIETLIARLEEITREKEFSKNCIGSNRLFVRWLRLWEHHHPQTETFDGWTRATADMYGSQMQQQPVACAGANGADAATCAMTGDGTIRFC